MARAFWEAVAPPLLISLAVSFMLERLIRPRVRPLITRGVRVVGVHVAIWLLLFCAEFVAFRRPWLAAANVCVLLYVFVLVSNAKLDALREPFIYQDFDYCVDMLKHPRLYLPFLGVTRALLGVGAIAGALYLGLRAEASLLTQVSVMNFMIGVTIMLVCGGLLLWWGSQETQSVEWAPLRDLAQFGFLPSLWFYFLAEKSAASIEVPAIFPRVASVPATALPDIVAVQSESFFDIRRHYPIVQRHVLSEYDNIVRDAAMSGRLSVPAWGANTVRTEFAFLAGTSASALGVHGFNPYRKLVSRSWPTIASYLRSLGYETVCVHPYLASFYRRDEVFPLLGFDRFVDIGQFDTNQMSGAYLDDITLADKVCELLGEPNGDRPRFVFVITMENHGPLHLEARIPEHEQQFFAQALPQGCDDMAVYLKHIKNADRMIAMLRAKIESLQRGGWLCWYGDHVPIMDIVYRSLGYPDGTSDYFLWGNDRGSTQSARCDLKVEELGAQLLRCARLMV